MKKIRLILLILIGISLFSCIPTRVPFTLEEKILFEGELDNLQFYIDQKVILRRNLKFEEKIIENRWHRIKIIRNRKVVEITIPQYTPGVLESIEDDTVFIRFEDIPDGKKRTIPFMLSKDKNRASGYLYELRAKTLLYGDEKYKVILAKRDVPVSRKDVNVYSDNNLETSEHHILKHEYPILMIELVEKDCSEDENRKVPGLKVKR